MLGDLSGVIDKQYRWLPDIVARQPEVWTLNELSPDTNCARPSPVSVFGKLVQKIFEEKFKPQWSV